jgi:hypothetical protein
VKSAFQGGDRQAYLCLVRTTWVVITGCCRREYVSRSMACAGAGKESFPPFNILYTERQRQRQESGNISVDQRDETDDTYLWDQAP